MPVDDVLETLEKIGFEVESGTLMGGICLISDHKETKPTRVGNGLLTPFVVLEFGQFRALYERKWETYETRPPIPVYKLVEVRNCEATYVPQDGKLVPKQAA